VSIFVTFSLRTRQPREYNDNLWHISKMTGTCRRLNDYLSLFYFWFTAHLELHKYNKPTRSTIFFTLLRYHASRCFRPTCSPSSGGRVYNVDCRPAVDLEEKRVPFGTVISAILCFNSSEFYHTTLSNTFFQYNHCTAVWDPVES
jgi:hypothetical protein